MAWSRCPNCGAHTVPPEEHAAGPGTACATVGVGALVVLVALSGLIPLMSGATQDRPFLIVAAVVGVIASLVFFRRVAPFQAPGRHRCASCRGARNR